MRPTIDDDLAQRVRRAAQDRGETHRHFVNEAVRQRLESLALESAALGRLGATLNRFAKVAAEQIAARDDGGSDR
jgi:Arc/MetJ family transcription regulator